MRLKLVECHPRRDGNTTSNTFRALLTPLRSISHTNGPLAVTVERVRRPVVLGVDGGNTKTVGLVVATNGEVLGAAMGTCTDIYGAESAEAALTELESVVQTACGRAGVNASDLLGATFSLAGADWPEDHAFLTSELTARLDLAEAPIVMNDSFGPIDVGTDDGIGVSLVCGTFLAVGARGETGTEWHSSFWIEPGGAHGLGSAALRAAYREEIGLAPATAMTPRLLELYAVTSTEELLKHFTRRIDPAPDADVVHAARILLDEASRGDPVAADVLESHAGVMHDHVVAAATKVGFREGYDLVLAGGVFAHEAHVLEALLVRALQRSSPQVRIVTTDLPPVAGAVLRALRGLGYVEPAARGRLAETIPAFKPAAGRPAFGVNRRHA